MNTILNSGLSTPPVGDLACVAACSSGANEGPEPSTLVETHVAEVS